MVVEGGLNFFDILTIVVLEKSAFEVLFGVDLGRFFLLLAVVVAVLRLSGLALAFVVLVVRLVSLGRVNDRLVEESKQGIGNHHRVARVSELGVLGVGLVVAREHGRLPGLRFSRAVAAATPTSASARAAATRASTSTRGRSRV